MSSNEILIEKNNLLDLFTVRMNSVTVCNEEDHKELVHKQENGKWLSNSEVSLSLQFFFSPDIKHW